MTALLPSGESGGLAEAAQRALARQLLGQGRFQLGWQFAHAEQQAPDPLRRPMLSTSGFGAAADAARLAATSRAWALGGVAAGGALLVAAGATSVTLAAPVMIPALAAAGVTAAGGGLTSAYARWRERVASERESERMDAHDRARRAAQPTAAASDAWEPVQAPADVTRTDVVCGTWDGWAAMIATTAGSFMRADRSVVVLDLTSHGVAEDLILLVNSTGQSVPCGRFPTDLSLVDLFHDLAPEAVGRVIGDAFAVLPGRSGAAEIRRRDEAIVQTVARRIARPWSFRRLAAGVRVLQRLSETRAGDGPGGGVLSLQEQHALMKVSHEFGRTPQEITELDYLVDTFEVLAGNEAQLRTHAAPPGGADEADTASPSARGLWGRGLTVLAAPIYNNDQGASARILLYRFLEDLRHGEPHDSDDLIVVAGVERLGRDVLDEFSQHARNARVRTMFLHQHVPPGDDAQRMLNTAGSVTLLMRTANAKEAQAAVELVGSEYRFVLSQETESTSASLGWSREQGETHGFSDSVDQQHGWNIQVGLRHGERLPVFTRSSGSSRGTTRTAQWSRSRGTSGSQEQGHASTKARVFEPSVQPVQIETLPETAFIVVNKFHFRQPVLGDCDPGLCLHPLAAGPPRTALPEDAA